MCILGQWILIQWIVIFTEGSKNNYKYNFFPKFYTLDCNTVDYNTLDYITVECNTGEGVYFTVYPLSLPNTDNSIFQSNTIQNNTL